MKSANRRIRVAAAGLLLLGVTAPTVAIASTKATTSTVQADLGTIANRQKLNDAAAQNGMTPSKYAGQLILNDLQGSPDPTPTPTPTPTPIPTPTPTPTPVFPPATSTNVAWGMSSPQDEWDANLSKVEADGGHLGARRLFATLNGVESYLSIAKNEAAKGRKSIISISSDGDAEWDKYANGAYDARLKQIIAEVKADGLDDDVFMAVQHEPFGDGTAPHYAAMQRHLVTVFKGTGVEFGPILNGYGWSNKSQKMTDAQIAAWLPDDLVPQFDFVGADTYQGGTTASPGEDAGVKIRNFSAWATRHGAKTLGLGEFNGLDAKAIQSALDAVKADNRFAFAAIFNSSRNNRPGVNWYLDGDRLKAFQSVLK